MVLLLILLALVTATAFAVLAMQRRRSSPPVVVTLELRTQLLTSVPDDFAISTSPEHAWAAVMDTTYSNASVSLISLSDGSASLYFSTGGGVIGGQARPTVNAAAKAFVSQATTYLQNFTATSTFPLPPFGYTRFYARTPEGVFSTEAPEAELGAGKHPLSQLFFAAQEVITQLRLVSEAAR